MPRTYLHIFVRLLVFTVPDIFLGRLRFFSPSAFLQPFWHQSLAPIDRTQLLQYFRAISTRLILTNLRRLFEYYAYPICILFLL